MKRARSLAILLLASITAWLILCAAVGIFAVEGALHPGRRLLSHQDEQQALDIATRNRAILLNVEIYTRDGASLRAWSIHPESGNGDAVILLHGQGDNRTGMLGPAQMLLRHGFEVLLPDARAHGMSGGPLATYGVLEADDIRLWLKWLRGQYAPHCIDGLGDSMGGAEILESLEVENGLCAVVAESPFATFREAAYDRLGQQFSTGPWLGRTLLRPAIAAGMEYARLRYDVDLSADDPTDTVAHSRVPVLLIHGTADTNLPSRHSEMIRAADPSVALWEPAGAGHCEASITAPAEYEHRVIAWFTEHNSPQIIAPGRR